MKLNIHFFILVLSFCSLGCIAQTAQELITTGINYHDQGNYQKALEQYEAVLKDDPTHLIALAEKSFSLFYLQEFEETAQTCKKAIDSHPKARELKTIYVTYGNALDALSKQEEAVKVYDEGITMFPDYYQLFFNKGVTLTNMNKLDLALKAFEHTLSINPKHASSHNAVARLALMNEMKIPALLAFGRFFILEPEGARNASNKKYFDDILAADVHLTDDKKVEIDIDPSQMEVSTEQKENDFSSIEIMLKMSAAQDYNKKNRKETEADRFIRKFTSICSLMSERAGFNYGFFWEYYGPYYIEMMNKEMITPFAHFIYSHYEVPESIAWLKDNPEEVKAYNDWSKNYNWYEN
jgi:Tfp pilus assembly protein PilF